MKNIVYAVLMLYFSIIINAQANNPSHENTFYQTSIKTSKGTRINKNINYIQPIKNKELSGLNDRSEVVGKRGSRPDYNKLLLGRASQDNQTKVSNTRSK